MPSIMGEQLIKRGIVPYRLFKVSRGPVAAYSGNGNGGQYVVVVPRAKLVAVRQIDANDDTESTEEGYGDFVTRVIALARPPAGSARPALKPQRRHACAMTLARPPSNAVRIGIQTIVWEQPCA